MALFTRNIDSKGRLLRGLAALALLVAGLLTLSHIVWLGILLLASSLFVFFEAFRGWCVLRACGIKTKF